MLVRGVTQSAVELASAGITFDPRTGFVVEEGKLRHHNGVFLCREEGVSNEGDNEAFTLVFSFAPPPTPAGGGDQFFSLPTPSVVEPFEQQWEVGEARRIECRVTVTPQVEQVGSLSVTD